MDATQSLGRLKDREAELKSVVDVTQAELDAARVKIKELSLSLEVRSLYLNTGSIVVKIVIKIVYILTVKMVNKIV